MYVTQTYLGFAVEGAAIYCYYLAAKHLSKSQLVSSQVIKKRVAQFAEITGKDVVFFIPHENYDTQTLQEIKDKPGSIRQKFYEEKIRKCLPGVLITGQPLKADGMLRGGVFIPLCSVKHPVKQTQELVHWAHNLSENFLRILRRLNTVIIMQPSIFGIGVDVNKILEQTINYADERLTVDIEEGLENVRRYIADIVGIGGQQRSEAFP